MVVAAWDVQDRWIEAGRTSLTWFKLSLYWGCHLALPVLLGLGVHALMHAVRVRCWRSILCLLTLCALGSLGLWASVIEPKLLHERHVTVHGVPADAPELRVAVVSDLHIGLYFRPAQLQRLVARLNDLAVDAILIPGDWTYDPPRDLHATFAPLQALRQPVFGVLGNHDLQAPGPNLAAELRTALQAHGVRLLEGQRLAWQQWTLIGLDDAWGGAPESQIARLWPASPASHPPAAPKLVIVHQPDTVAQLPQAAAFLAVAGHTHGGQIQLPVLTEQVLRGMSRYGWVNGAYRTSAGHLWVSSGIGTIGLPARLGTPPTIDVLTLRH
jgi:predicted MPP superfamily phosphohydrolase